MRIQMTLVCLTALMMASGAAIAQESTAELRGRVLDAQGGALPGVTITITNQATGVYREVVSNGDGTYFATALAPGMYSIAAELTGFKKYMRSDVRLDLGRTTTLDLALEIGGLTESVSVTAETPLVDTTSKQIGGNVTTREVSTLPSINGNFVGMVALLPGIVANISTESFGSDAVSVNGLDSRNNNYMLDGANNNDDVIGQRAGSQARTPVEAIAEFQVVTNQYDAEFGRTTGAIINAISKQGTNAFHGVGAALIQDASMTRPDFFVKQNGLAKPETRFQTYRANIGGPIVRDKAHFFANVERVMVNRPNTITIPSHSEFNASPVTRDRVWNTLLRFDHQVNATNTWTVRWLRESSPQVNQIVPYLPPFPGAQNITVTQNASREEHDVDQTVVGTWNSVLSNTKVNTARVNFTREDVAFANPGFNGNGQDQAALKPTLVFLTYMDQQSPVAQARVDNAYQFDDTFSWFIPHGGTSHDVKMGGQYEYVGARSTAQDNINGIFFFRSDLPFSAGDPRTYPERLYVRVPGALNTFQKAHFASAFAQDKWTVTRRTTLSLGLRYDIEIQPLREVDNPRFSDADAYPVDKNNFGPRVGVTYDLSGDGHAVVRAGYGRFYDKTHFELISNILTAGVFSPSFNTFFPANNADPGPSVGTLPQDPMLAGGPVVNRTLLASLFPAGSRVKNTGTVTLDNPDRTIPYSDQFTAGYERQIATNLSASADYIHSQARDQFMLRDLNPGVRASTARTATLVRTDPAFTAAVNQPVNVGEIDYDGLEAALVKRFASDYSFRVSYTFGYARGNTSARGIPTSPFQFLDDLHLELNDGPTDFDRRHNLVISGQALVPRVRGVAVSWVARAVSGAPFSLTDSTLDPDRNGTFAEPLPAATYTGTGRNPYTADARAERNGAYGPGLFQIDLRLGYRGRAGGRTIDLFADVFNVTNRANFDNPIGDRRSTDFLRLTTLRPGAVPTTVQLGVRYEF
ncbi:MAG TPA: carboxypeptidase regulatory-like domain-containing protein [Vicinamibacterales bacterium]